MILQQEFDRLHSNDQNTLLNLWHCPYDRTLLKKLTGQNTGDLEIRRGPKKTSIALQNSVNLRRIPEKELDNAKVVANLTFQLVQNDYITFHHVACPKGDYRGYAPKLPFQLRSDHRNEELIQKLLADSARYQKQLNKERGSQGGRSGIMRFGIFGFFILIWLAPLIGFAAFMGWVAIYSLFAL